MTWNEPDLRRLAETLPFSAEGTAAWEAWATRAGTCFRAKYRNHLDAFVKLVTLPEPLPRVIVSGLGGVPDHATQERAHAIENARHFEVAMDRAREPILALLESVDELVEQEAPRGPCARVLQLLDRFPRVARQLRDRYSGRDTLIVKDEYDVQNLLHALLLIDFDDVRAEDPAPSQGGSSSRVDFVLHSEEIVIEVKKTREKLRNKELTSQINDDAGRYQKHPACKTLVCFVYDPDHLVKNPKGFENDHTRPEGALNLITVVRPQ